MSRGAVRAPGRDGPAIPCRPAGRVTQRGAVTAETALMIPLVVSLALAMVWFIAVGLAQMRVTDAAREAARALARGDPVAQAEALVDRVAPGASVEVRRADGRVVTVVRERLVAPDGLLSGLPGAVVTAEAVALVEEGG